MSFCAVCTHDADGSIRRPLGRNGGMVTVCSDCDTEPAREKRGPELPCEFTEGTKGWKKSVAKNAQKSPFGKLRSHVTVEPKTPGWLIERVQRRRGLDAAESAARAFAGCSWATQVRYLGSDRQFFLFERPDPELARKARMPEDAGLESIEQFRVKP